MTKRVPSRGTRGGHGRWQHAAAALILLAAGPSGCGADGIDAEPTQSPAECQRLEAVIPELGKLAADGSLSGLKRAIAEQMTEDVRQGTVRALLQIVRALPAGAIDGLVALQDRGVLAGLTAPLADLLRTVEAAGQPAYDALAVFDEMLFECDGQPVFVTLGAVLRDPGFRTDVETLLASGLDLSGVLLDLGVDVASLDGREGFQALFASLLAAISADGFDIDALIGPAGLLGAIVDPTDPVLSSLTGAVERLLAPGPALDSVRGLSVCMLELDSDRAIGGLLFDLVRAGVLDTLTGLAKNVAVADAFFAIDSALLPVLDLLAADSVLRDQLVVGLDVLLRPEVVPLVLPDVLILLDRGIVPEVVSLLGALTQDRCL